VRDVPYADNFHLELLYGLLNRRTVEHTKLPAGVFDMAGQVFGERDGEWADYLEGGFEADGE
jgi:hypothetical protein